MGTHQLVTGLNGAGKSLFSVATKLAPMVAVDKDGRRKVTIKYKGRDIPRRLVVGGIPELAIEHALMEVPEIDTEEWVDLWRKVDRRGGDPPVEWLRLCKGGKGEDDYYEIAAESDPGAEPVVHSFICWWLWVQPGDYVVVDEAQRVFRPLASGRRVPRFIARLETARHYGIELLYLTQFPNLLHANVRALAGPHEDVQRIWGSSSVVVYLWERASSVTATAKATKRIWKHDRKAFGLYKSSELHTKFKQPLPLAAYAFAFALLALCIVGYFVRDRLAARFGPAEKVIAERTEPKTRNSAPPAAAAPPSVRFPVYDPEPFRGDREPLAGRAIQLEGGYTVGGVSFATFGLVIDGQRVASVNLAHLVRMGYSYTEVGPCAGLLRYRQQERVITCGKRRADDPGRSVEPARSAASEPTT